ncbi:MAG: hypothetical protein A3J27_07720 [Candidatus Tectomicrobia bacterium RIFCSPLOWO2_12_FULL_69_37]|nr:MAG: hypothetical protein A3J27_07720 [Candidatus Tectomicrobia bacterium RIFCSPLOWO2_12_FULL_69_37]
MQTPEGEWTEVPSNEVLDLAALRPGDIILSRPKGLESALIAFFGQSDFSHAQLLVPDDCLGSQHTELKRKQPIGRQRCTLAIEATTDFDPIIKQIVGGVGYRRLPLRYLRPMEAPPHQSQTVSPLSSYLYFDVFRHRSADTEEFREFVTSRIPEICHRYEHRPYASLRDLAQVTATPWIVETLGSLLKIIPQSPRPGLFCSQFVASIFADGGFPLTDCPPARVRPRDLALARTTLERITRTTRIAIEEHVVIRTYSEILKELFPDLLTDIGKETMPSSLTDFDDMLRAVGEEEDFGRAVTWGSRDCIDAANARRAQMEQMIGSVEDFAAMVARVL